MLLACLQRDVNGGGVVSREDGIGRRRIDLLIERPYADAAGTQPQREAVELEVGREGRPDPLAEGLRQLDEDLARAGLDAGVLVLFDRRTGAAPIEERVREERAVTGRAAGRSACSPPDPRTAACARGEHWAAPVVGCRMTSARPSVLLLLVLAACGSGEAPSAPLPPPPPVPPASSAPAIAAIPGAAGDVLLDTDATLAADGHASWRVPVVAGERVRVTVTSTSFDPILVVQPPGAGRLSNDDAGGDRTRSELDLRVVAAGDLKIEVGVWGAPGPGTFHVRAERVSTPAPALAAAAPPAHHAPWGGALAPGASGYVAGTAPTVSAAPPPAAVRVGERVEGSLGLGDAALPSGELADHFTLEVTEAGHFLVQMQSSALDAFLVVTSPTGERLENDDSGGTRDATVEIDAAAPGTWDIVATTYRPGMAGRYELKVLSARDLAPVAGAPAAGAERLERGALAAGDAQLGSGEWYDTYEVSWPVGTAVRLEARSSAFDTYLILRTPSGRQLDNDDQTPGNLDAAIDFVVSEPGPHRVLVTSYAAGMSGAYELAMRGGGSGPSIPPSTGPAPASPAAPAAAAAPPLAAARTERGELAAGDRTLSSGEFSDTFPMTFVPGAPVSVRLESSAFDTYLIVRSPSGRQQDNDDLRPGVLNSGIDIPAAEAGEYQVVVTSYRPGERGAYTLTVTPGAPGAGPPPVAAPGTGPVPGPAPTGPGPGGPAAPAPGGGTRVWAVSVGISDYPGAANDLPECANDAVKIVEALRQQGLSSAEREFLLTDANATRANVRDALARVAAGIQPGDVFVFFYSGHGGQTRAAHEGDPNELDGLDEYLVAYDGNLGDDELGELLGRIRARTTLVALDACFSGGFAKDVVNRPDVVGMFSSEEDVTSGVAPEFRAGGYLSHFLRMGIGGEGDSDPRDRALTVGELSHYVWRQYAEHGADLRMGEGYQHLVVDRGSVHNDTVLWNVGG